MASAQATRAHTRRLVLAGVASLLFALALVLVLAQQAAAASTVSSNWGGYAALPSARSQHGFSSVSGSWRIPQMSCTARRDSYSAVWVGLGGYGRASNGLEQVGTDADCSYSGHARYASWFELIPAAPVRISLEVHAGDQMVGSVTARGRRVTLRLRDLTSGAAYSTTRSASVLDTSSADWIVEAPSDCEGSNCQTLTLADFGTLSFLSATAVSGSHTGPVEDPSWSHVAIELRQSARPEFARFANGRPLGPSLISASPSSLQGELGAFSLTWGEQQLPGEAPREAVLG